MAQPNGYSIISFDATNAANYPADSAADKVTVDKYEAKRLVSGGQRSRVDGTIRARHQVLELETYEKALEHYHSEEYQRPSRCGRLIPIPVSLSLKALNKEINP